jgi:hypothetical protein
MLCPPNGALDKGSGDIDIMVKVQSIYFLGAGGWLGDVVGISSSPTGKIELGCVWKYIIGCNLNCMHDFVMDAIAQMDIVTSNYFLDFIDRSNAIQYPANFGHFHQG